MLLSDRESQRENNIDFLRFFAAALVLFSHSFFLSGHHYIDEPYTRICGYNSSGALALQIFFILSGFLITKSWLTKPYLLSYLRNRFLRIYPGLVVCTLFTVFVIGPMVTIVGWDNYFKDPITWLYFKSMLLFPFTYQLPGVFRDIPDAWTVNGALWTLPMELVCYAIVAITGVLGILRRRWVIVAWVLLLALIDCHLHFNPPLYDERILTMRPPMFFHVTLNFFIGSLYYLFRRHIRLDAGFCFMALALLVATFQTQWGYMWCSVAIPYIVIYVAFLRVPRLSGFGRYGDFSYGLYIYGYPIQQTLMHFFFPHLEVYLFFLLSLLFTLVCAVLSWKFVEAPALRFKSPRLPVAAPIPADLPPVAPAIGKGS